MARAHCMLQLALDWIRLQRAALGSGGQLGALAFVGPERKCATNLACRSLPWLSLCSMANNRDDIQRGGGGGGEGRRQQRRATATSKQRAALKFTPFKYGQSVSPTTRSHPAKRPLNVCRYQGLQWSGELANGRAASRLALKQWSCRRANQVRRSTNLYHYQPTDSHCSPLPLPPIGALPPLPLTLPLPLLQLPNRNSRALSLPLPLLH